MTLNVLKGCDGALALISLTLAPYVALEPSGEGIALRAAVVGFRLRVDSVGEYRTIVAATRRQLAHDVV